VKIALFDYGAGNLHSLGKALTRTGAEVEVVRDWKRALGLDALVLPGVGAFSAAVEALPDDPDRVRDALEEGLPCLGICLGMQLFFESSEEGSGRGIGLIPGRVRRLEAAVVPQMGWNDVETAGDPLFEGVDALVAYYANSFVCEPAPSGSDDDRNAGSRGDRGPDAHGSRGPGAPGDSGHADSHAIAWSDYDDHRYVAAVRKGRSWGVQFHPEKSSRPGLRIVENFVSRVREGGRR